MTDYPYDPDFPFVVVRLKTYDEDKYPVGIAEAKFREKQEAEHYYADFADGFAAVIDTTPKPRIPEDATVISWDNEAYLKQMAQRDPDVTASRNLGWYWYGEENMWVSEVKLLEYIDDAEIIVLDERK